jgi:hypothetical protein
MSSDDNKPSDFVPTKLYTTEASSSSKKVVDELKVPDPPEESVAKKLENKETNEF